MKCWKSHLFLALESIGLTSVFTVNLNESVEELRTGKRVQHEVLVH